MSNECKTCDNYVPDGQNWFGCCFGPKDGDQVSEKETCPKWTEREED